MSKYIFSMDNSGMNHFIVRSWGDRDLKITNMTSYDAKIYIYEPESRRLYEGGSVNELSMYLEGLERCIRSNQISEIDGVILFKFNNNTWCWILAHDAFDAVNRFQDLLTKITQRRDVYGL